MRTLVAIVLGFLSGAMLFLLAGTVTDYRISVGPTLAVAILALLAGWATSAYLIRRNAATTSAAGQCCKFQVAADEMTEFRQRIRSRYRTAQR
jgi:F0F1-type ATP synthase assembly protein I